MSTAPTYAARFSGPRRDSANGGAVKAQGRVEWSKALDRGTADGVQSVLLWKSLIVVDATRTVTAYAADGQRRWERAKLAGSPAVVGGDHLLVTNPESRLESVDVANALVLTNAPFPGLANHAWLVKLLWPGEKDFISTTYLADPPYNVEAMKAGAPSPQVSARRTVYGKAIGAWGLDQAGALKLPPLFIPERDEWVAAVEVHPAGGKGPVNEVVVANVRAKTEPTRFKLPLEAPVEWSASAAGELSLVGHAGKRKVALGISTAGAELWHWFDEKEDDRWASSQPPLQAPGGRVLLLTEGRLIALSGGKVAWIYDARSESLRHGAHAGEGAFEVKDGHLLSTVKLRYATVMADGSVVLVGKKTLTHVAADGRPVFSLDLPEEIATPPVVDAAGSIYVAGPAHLFKII